MGGPVGLDPAESLIAIFPQASSVLCICSTRPRPPATKWPCTDQPIVRPCEEAALQDLGEEEKGPRSFLSDSKCHFLSGICEESVYYAAVLAASPCPWHLEPQVQLCQGCCPLPLSSLLVWMAWTVG